MNMRHGLLAFAIPTGILACAHTGDAQVFLTEEQALRSLFGNSHVDRQERTLREEDRQALIKVTGLRFPESSVTFLIGQKDQKTLGYAVVLNEIGKSEPITFMVAVSPDHRVMDVLVMTFRENRGSEVRESRFLRQFKGKQVGDPIAVNGDIINYSGATLSSKAIARGVKRALGLVKHFYPPSKVSHNSRPAFMLPVMPVLGAPGVYRQVRYVMGTLCEIRLGCASSAQASASASAAFTEIRRLETVFSAYDAASELSYVNREAFNGPVPVSDDMWTLTRSALRYARATAGVFDVTVGPLVNGREAGLRSVGSHKVSLDAEDRTIRFNAAGMEMDFGGIAKGYAAERAAAVLGAWEIPSALINLGGSSIVTTRGQRDWLIGIADPSSPQHYAAIVVGKPGISISCSGVYERAHIFDPRTGEPLTGLRSAVAITKSAVLGEVLSKQLLLQRIAGKGSREYLWLTGSGDHATSVESNLNETVLFTRQDEAVES